jgi:hypothetical protein
VEKPKPQWNGQKAPSYVDQKILPFDLCQRQIVN